MTRYASTVFLRPAALLAVGVVLTILTGPRWGVAPLAWLAPVPYLLWARKAHSLRSWSWLFVALLTGYAAQCAIFATTPVPVIGVIGFAPPLAVLRFASIALSETVRRRTGETAGLGAYVATTVLTDWLGYGVSEFGAWMATANSQVEWLTFMQVAAVAGLAGAGALMAWTSGSIAAAIGSSRSVWSTQRRIAALIPPAITVTAVLLWGALRLDQPVPGSSVSVAAVVTNLGLTETGLPEAEALRRNTDALFDRTRIAASRGARLVVWNEIATVIQSNEEPALIDRARDIARELGIDLVVAYGVLATTDPILFDNKYAFISNEGEVLDEYRKHHPVPGEPSIRGREPIRVLDRPYGRVAGAICYDYDFPALAREHARLGADLVVVPSSDWRGIDPIHTYMARTRAIEGGFTLLRAVRWAPSAVFDSLGRTRSWMSALDDADGVMVTRVPVGRMATPALAIADTPAIAAGLIAGGLLLFAFAPRRGIAAASASLPRVVIVFLGLLTSACEIRTPNAPGEPMARYDGTWTATYRVTECTDTAGFEADRWCARTNGAIGLFVMTLSQNGDAVTGTMMFGAYVGPVSGNVGVNGTLTLSGVTLLSPMSITIANWSTHAQPINAMGGSFTLRVTSTTTAGSATQQCQIESATRTPPA